LTTLDASLNAYIVQQHQEVIEQAEIQAKYEMYIQKEKDLVEKSKKLENYYIPSHFEYSHIQALSAEGREKLTKIRPSTLGQASKISGVSPADIAILMVYMGR